MNGVDHIGLTVSRLERSIPFYRLLLGREPVFQQVHHPADRGGGYVELGAGGGKAAGPGRSLERLDTVEKEQPPHVTLRKTDARAR